MNLGERHISFFSFYMNIPPLSNLLHQLCSNRFTLLVYINQFQRRADGASDLL